MTPEEILQLKELFLAALEQPAADRRAWLALQNDASPAVRERVAAQLGGLDQDPDAYDTPVAPSLPTVPPSSVIQRIGARLPVREEEQHGADDHGDRNIPGQAQEQIAHYRILDEIARGGVGVVFRGRDVDLGREVAVKVLQSGHARSPEMIRRFVEEAQIGGQLQHPGIVPVYELGVQADERPFFTMKLVQGSTLASLLDERDGADRRPDQLIAIFAQVCQTMAYAHARGVIHRDLKPANIMVGSFGEVQVVDRGMAKVLDGAGSASPSDDEQPADASPVATLRSTPSGSSDPSLAGSVMGTPAYMAPEQARGEVADLDARADVFALGAILCEVLTDDPPFPAGSDSETLRRAAVGDLDKALDRLERCVSDPELARLPSSPGSRSVVCSPSGTTAPRMPAQ